MSGGRNRAVALGVAGVGAGIAAIAAFQGARKYRALGPLDMSELELPSDVEPISVTVDDGTTIHGVQSGTGRPIVLLHGVMLSVATWPCQFAKLSKGHRVIALDARGHGKSVADAAGWGIDRMASDVAQVIAQLDLKDAIVVGHSMGGMTTQQLCLDFPDLARERIAGTILLSTSASPAQGVPGFKQFNRFVKPGAFAARQVARRTKSWIPPAEIGYAMARLALGAQADPRHVTHTQKMATALSPRTISALMPNVIGFETRPRLKDYPVPALVIVGSRDLLTPPRVGRELARRIPGAEFEVVPGAGHMLMLERGEWLNDRIARFVDAH